MMVSFERNGQPPIESRHMDGRVQALERKAFFRVHIPGSPSRKEYA